MSKALWQLLKTDQDGEAQPLELQAYLAFLNNILKIFHDVVLLLEGQDGTIRELYDIMLTLKTKLQLLSNSFLTKGQQQSNMIFPTSTRLHSTTWKNGMTSQTTTNRRMLHAWR